MTDDVFPHVVERYKNYASLYWNNRPGIVTYRVTAANNVDDAYRGQSGGALNGVAGAFATGTEVLFDVGQGSHFRSRGIRKKGLGLLDEVTRNQTRAIFDLDEFHDPPTTTVVPPDKEMSFIRSQVHTKAMAPGVFGTEGPILILQSPSFAVVPRPAVTFAGTAPDVTAVAGVVPPPESMEVRVPFYGDSLVFINHSTTDEIYISMGLDMPMMQIDPSQSFTHTSGQKDSLVIAASGANPTFSVLISTVQGQR